MGAIKTKKHYKSITKRPKESKYVCTSSFSYLNNINVGLLYKQSCHMVSPKLLYELPQNSQVNGKTNAVLRKVLFWWWALSELWCSCHFQEQDFPEFLHSLPWSSQSVSPQSNSCFLNPRPEWEQSLWNFICAFLPHLSINLRQEERAWHPLKDQRTFDPPQGDPGWRKADAENQGVIIGWISQMELALHTWHTWIHRYRWESLFMTMLDYIQNTV